MLKRRRQARWFLRQPVRVVSALVLLHAQDISPAAQHSAAEEVGSKVCANCHAAIFKQYQASAMAQTSGWTQTKPLPGANRTVHHAGSGAQCRLSPDESGYALDCELPPPATPGRLTLQFYIGSGRLGHSYLFHREGVLFQAPVSYYAAAARWDLSPGYRRLDFARTVGVGCLQCHASRLQPLPQSEDGLAFPPFLEGGVSCERCHGPAKRHVAGDRGAIVNPARLDAVRRDSICAQCHLTGAARIARRGRKPAAFRAGEQFSDFIAVFVWKEAAADLSATSHFEHLHQSACKRASGDRLWCGSCHNPHGPPQADRLSDLRKRCLSCHEQKPCAETMAARRRQNDSCTSCHMRRSQAPTMDHVAFTDHRIPRRPALSRSAQPLEELVPFFPGPVDARDQALAYAVASAVAPSLRKHALEWLQAARNADPDDLRVLAQLAQLYDQSGSREQAQALYERILKGDAAHSAALINLGAYQAQAGRLDLAMQFWLRALQRNLALTHVSMNLAVAQFRSGDPEAAEATLRRALQYDPTHEAARKLLADVQAARR